MADDIGDRIAELRRLLGLTQEQMAKLFGRGWKQVSAWERGKQKPPTSVLEWASEANDWPIRIFQADGPRPMDVVKRPTGAGVIRERTPDYTRDAEGAEASGIDVPPEHDLIREILMNPAAFTRRLNTLNDEGIPVDAIIGWLEDVEQITTERGYKFQKYFAAERERLRGLGGSSGKSHRRKNT